MIKLKKTIKKKLKTFKNEKPIELRYPKVSLINGSTFENDYFYRDLEMFRPSIDEETW